MRVLIGCEFSGVVRDAFISAGHDAVSNDIIPSEKPGPHIVGDLFKVIKTHGPWDMLIFHWDCTNMAVSGARWFKNKKDVQAFDVMAFEQLMEAPVPRIAGENPISVLSSKYRKPDQIIWPWWFGHRELKRTCLWLKNLPPLMTTDNVGPPPTDKEELKSWERVHREGPGPNRKKNRSRTLPGIAAAYTQWGNQ